MPELAHHLARDVGGALDVVGRAAGRVPHQQLLGDPPAHQDRHLRLEVVGGVRVPIGLGQLHRHAERAAARDDRHLVQRVGVRQQRRDHRVARLVVRAVDALLRRSSPATAARRPSAPCRAPRRSRRRSPAAARARAASSAASFTRFARSAPEKPGVPRAIDSQVDVGGQRDAAACGRAGSRSRPFRSGAPTVTWRSKRPGRSSAWSRMSGRLVAAITTMPRCGAKPSISTSSWLSVCSRSSWLSELLPRARPTASSSSMKTMHVVVAGGVLEQPADARRADAGVHLDEVGAAGEEERHARLARRSTARAASCRCPAGRPAGRPSASGRRAS